MGRFDLDTPKTAPKPLRDHTAASPLILASASPRRHEIISGLGLTFEVVKPNIDESAILRDTPEELVLALSRAKAEHVANLCPGRAVLAADTLVAIGGAVLGKPRDGEDAKRMLGMLSGNVHDVFTGVTAAANGRVLSAIAQTRVAFRALSEGEIRAYIQTGEPMDKAGAYAIQGMGEAFVEGIEGAYSNVVGLPVDVTVNLLTDCLNLADMKK